MTVPDFPDEKAPDAHATAISLTGAPPLVLENLVDVQIGTSIPASGTLTRPASGQFTINQPAYEVILNVGTLGGTAPILSIELQWYDHNFGQLIDSELYYFYSGNVNGHQVHGRGPTKGDRLVVVVKNFNATSGVSFTYTLIQVSRTYTREFWRTVGKAGVQPVYPGFTAAASDISANLLSAESHSIGAAGTTSVLLPLYTGSVRLVGTTSDTTAGNSRWLITPTSDQVAGSIPTFQGANGESGFAPDGPKTLWVPDVALPRAQCTLLFSNTNATTTEILTAAVTAKEDRA